MTLTSVDKNYCYILEIENTKWGGGVDGKLERCISFELNNLEDEVKYPIPNETTFVMSIEDAKQLYAWLGAIL